MVEAQKAAAKMKRAESAAKKKKTKCKAKKARVEGGGHNLSTRNAWASFPEEGRRITDQSSSDADAKKGGGTRLIGMNISSTDATDRIEAMTHKLLATCSNGSHILVEDLSEKRNNIQKMYSMLLGDAVYEAAKGGTKFEGGVVLGVWEDYDDNAPSNTKDRSISDGDPCLAKWNKNVCGWRNLTDL